MEARTISNDQGQLPTPITKFKAWKDMELDLRSLREECPVIPKVKPKERTLSFPTFFPEIAGHGLVTSKSIRTSTTSWQQNQMQDRLSHYTQKVRDFM